jgi:hypothetical protein
MNKIIAMRKIKKNDFICPVAFSWWKAIEVDDPI